MNRKNLGLGLQRDSCQSVQLLKLARIYKFGLACIYGPAHEILVLIKNALSHSLNIDTWIRFVPSLHLHPYFVSVSNIGSGETAQMCRLV